MNFSPETLAFIVIVFLIIMYVVLDGFDLGTGVLLMAAKNETQKKTLLNAIGPVWNGNEVWLIVAGGALFAGFPTVYATCCEAFYEPIMAVLACFILRAVSIEVRGFFSLTGWKTSWDTIFCASSLLIAFSLGILLGNVVQGIPLNEAHEFLGSTLDLLNPYALLFGLLIVSLCTVHACTYCLLKTEGNLHDTIFTMSPWLILVFILTIAATFIATTSIKAFSNAAPAALLCTICIPLALCKKRERLAFIASCCTITLLLALFAMGSYPTLLRSLNDPKTLSLTVQNASASATSLKALLLYVAIGLPFVMAYAVFAYKIFCGKVHADDTDY